MGEITDIFKTMARENPIAIISAKDLKNNYIPKEKVKSVLEREIKQLEDKPQYSWVGSEWSEREVVEELEYIKQELLEEQD